MKIMIREIFESPNSLIFRYI